MTTMIYDGTFEGLLSAVFEVYERKLGYVSLQKGEQQHKALFDDLIRISTDTAKTNRVLK